MDTAARWAAPESPIWLLESERKSNARFNRRPWETKQDTSVVMRGTYRQKYAISSGLYLCDMCSTCITNRIECQVEWHEALIGRSGRWESRPNYTSNFISYPVISQGQVCEAWPKNTQHTRVWECKLRFIWTISVTLCETFPLLGHSLAVFREKKVVALLWKSVALQCHSTNIKQRLGEGSITFSIWMILIYSGVVLCNSTTFSNLIFSFPFFNPGWIRPTVVQGATKQTHSVNDSRIRLPEVGAQWCCVHEGDYHSICQSRLPKPGTQWTRLHKQQQNSDSSPSSL